MSAHQPSQGQEIPADQLAALIAEGTHLPQTEALRTVIVATYRIGFAAALGYTITVEDGRVMVGDRPEADAQGCASCRTPAEHATLAAWQAAGTQHEGGPDDQPLPEWERALLQDDTATDKDRTAKPWRGPGERFDWEREPDKATTHDRTAGDAAVTALAVALYQRQVLRDLADDQPAIDVVRAALAHIDHLDTALIEAARDGGVFLRDGLNVEQEIRIDALDSATRLGIRPESPAAGDEAAAARAAITVASAFEAYIRDGQPDSEAPVIAYICASGGQQRVYAPEEVTIVREPATDSGQLGTVPLEDDKGATLTETWIDELLPGVELTDWQRGILRKVYGEAVNIEIEHNVRYWLNTHWKVVDDVTSSEPINPAEWPGREHAAGAHPVTRTVTTYADGGVHTGPWLPPAPDAAPSSVEAGDA